MEESLIGKKYGRLVVIAIADTKSKVVCKCDCGNEVTVSIGKLKNGHTKSCGCLQKEKVRLIGKSNKKHGMAHSRLYNIWHSMKQRCLYEGHIEANRYSERGITICEEWKNSFEAFRDWSLANGYQDDLSIDRIDNDNGYCPENCRWTDCKTQANNRSSNVVIGYNGKFQNIECWSIETGIAYATIWYRIKHGWSVEDALTTPVGMKRGI